MRRGLIITGSVLAVLVVGGAAFIWFSGGSGEPSTDVTAPTVATTTTTTTATTSSTSTSTEPSDDGAEPSDGPITYELTGESRASFTLQEDLRGERTTVVGTTPDVVAQLIVDPSDPSSAQLGEILINARTLTTDAAFRDRAIRSQILESASDEFEFIRFVPTSIDGLPEEAADSFTFTVTGDLTIRDITQSVTFDVTIDEVSSSGIVGTAAAQVLREDFDLVIPSVPSVANVTEEVDLELFFVAEPVS